MNIHIVIKCVIRIIVRAKASLSHMLCTHIIEMVTALQIVPVLTDTTSLRQTNTFTDLINLTERFLLQYIS